MRIGLHVSIAGGVSNSIERAAVRGCEALQIFAGNPRNWQPWSVTEEEAELFKKLRDEAGLYPLVVHAAYLINPATANPDVAEKSLNATIEAVITADRLGADAFVVHSGSAGLTPRAEALERVAGFVSTVFEGARPRLKFLLENTAGGGGQVGSSFDDLAAIIEGAGGQENLGVCLDTAHAFAAGYDLSSSAGVVAVLSEFDAKIGLNRLGAIHANDSKFPLGSTRDRHEHIGEGYLGAEAFNAILNRPDFRHLPCILETPGDQVDDARNVGVMKALRQP